MSSTPLHELIPVLQVAVGPVILISGVGLILLSLTNRFGRAVDRSRQLAQEMRRPTEANRPRAADPVFHYGGGAEREGGFGADYRPLPGGAHPA